MVFRLAFLLALAVSMLDLEIVLGIEKANPIAKGVLIVAALAYCATRRRERVNLALVGAIVACVTLAGLFCSFPLFGWDRFARSLVSLLAFLLLLCAWPTTTDRRFVLTSLALAPSGAILLGACYQVVGLRQLFEVDFLGATRLGGSVGPAFLGAMAATGAAAAAFLYGDRLRWFYPLLAAVNVAIAALSGSRMAFAVTVAVTGFVMLAQRRGFLFKFVVVVYGSAALAMFLAIFSEQIIARLMSRTLSGRELIWNELQGYIQRYPKLGIGLGHQMDVLSTSATVMTHTIAAHNEYLRFILELGYFGAAIFAFLFLAMLVTVLRSPHMRQPLCFALAAAAFLVFSATDNTFSVPFCFLLLVGAMMGACTPQDGPEPVAAAAAPRGAPGVTPLSGALVRAP